MLVLTSSSPTPPTPLGSGDFGAGGLSSGNGLVPQPHQVAGGLDITSELGAVLGPGFEVSLVRAANRQTVELALDGAVQFGIVHVLAHGATSVLDFGGERMSEAELVSLMSSQKALQFVFLACCNGYEAAGGIHNALHVPVVAYNAPIDDRAAVEFARGFYRSWRRDRDVSQAVDRGREALAVLFPSEAGRCA